MDNKKTNSFYSDVLTLFKGNTIAQSLPILISPIIARLYSPENFSDFGVYMSLLVILTVFATGKYELAIMLPAKNRDALNIFLLSIILSLIVSMIAFLLVINPYINIFDYFNIEGNKKIFYLLPISVLVMGIYNSLYYLNNRRKQFKILAKNKVYRGLTIASNNILFGSLGMTNFGLIVSNTIGNFFAAINLFIKNIDLNKLYRSLSFSEIVKLSSKYKKFPIFDLPASFFFRLYSEMLVLFFNSFFSPLIAGMYFFANRIIKTPSAFFISSFQDVFFQKISEDPNQIGEQIEKFSKKVFKRLIIPFFTIIYSSYFFNDFLFGEKWVDLYKYFYFISLPIFISIINSPFAHVLKVLNKQEYSLVFHISRFFILLTSLYFMVLNNLNEYHILIIFSFLESLFYITIAVFTMKILNHTYSFYLKLLLLSIIVTLINLTFV